MKSFLAGLVLVLLVSGFFVAFAVYPEFRSVVIGVTVGLFALAWGIGAHLQNRYHNERCRREGRSPWAL
ncbi:hypothetical protein OPIT5_29240 [Opitutaceae bacterium TAV5]|nr:hypothetical protein OPIT5_21880 [Opitutaceae bacterium TAV5]AHF94878.1 hypothetical protein OPIT5_29240 [Opitutaceae bacterium TAV5]